MILRVRSSFFAYIICARRRNVKYYCCISTNINPTSPVTASTLFELPARPSAPTTPVFVYNDASYPGKVILTGLTSFSKLAGAVSVSLYLIEIVVLEPNNACVCI